MGRPPVERVTVACFACGKEIVKRKSDADRNVSQRFFCSRKCLHRIGAKPRQREERSCEWCGKNFYPPWAAEDPARFCSKKCYDTWQRRNRVEIVCENCGTVTIRKPAHGQTARFCSKKCEGIARRKHALDREYNGKPALVDHFGYVRIYMPEHPNAYDSGWMPEHRYIAEQELGRLLTSDEHVHHVNGDKQDNRPENLVVMGHGEHSSITALANAKRLREWAEYRRRYGPLD